MPPHTRDAVILPLVAPSRRHGPEQWTPPGIASSRGDKAALGGPPRWFRRVARCGLAVAGDEDALARIHERADQFGVQVLAWRVHTRSVRRDILILCCASAPEREAWERALLRTGRFAMAG